jgi:predicted short-subunit dehydrogenase-like oxidoreductase (DUF2520 family)
LDNRIYIIGTGKVGSAFAFELKDRGFKVDFLTDRNSGRLKELSGLIHPIAHSEKIESDFVKGSQLIIISVQERFIPEVIKTISGFETDLSEKYFIITSGSESTDIFPTEHFNAELLLSMHPIQTFDKVSKENKHLLENIYFGIEGGIRARAMAEEIAAGLNSKTIIIPKEKKQLYHSACVISSNFLVTLLNVSSEVMWNLGISKSETFKIFEPIIKNTLNNISQVGLVNSLTGPFERNDVETISNHLSSISKELPSLIPFYTLLGMETVKVAFKKESLNMKNVIEILDLLNEYIVKERDVTNRTIN